MKRDNPYIELVTITHENVKLDTMTNLKVKLKLMKDEIKLKKEVYLFLAKQNSSCNFYSDIHV